MSRECKHEKIFEIHGHCNDLFSWNYNGEGWADSDYAPEIEGLCSGDDIEIKVCLICHQVVGLLPEDIETFVEEYKLINSDLDGDLDEQFGEDE